MPPGLYTTLSKARKDDNDTDNKEEEEYQAPSPSLDDSLEEPPNKKRKKD